jgi:hypothetical protein
LLPGRLLLRYIAMYTSAVRPHTYKRTVLLVTILGLSASGLADDPVKTVKKAVERSTLNQAGTKPFHLKAVLAPSLDRDRGSNRTGEVEIWWVSPTQWRQEVRSPEFHQVAIVNGQREWQKNEGDYFPEWLREICVALIAPVPSLDQVLRVVKEAEVRKLMGKTYFSWTLMSTDGNVEKGIGAGLAVTDKTGLLFYGNGLGWGGLYEGYRSFHGRTVARTVKAASPEVTAKVTVLEDLRDAPPDFFDASASGGDPLLLRTVVVEEKALRINLLPREPATWPALQDGPLEGAITAAIVVDRMGNVRELGSVLSDNPGLSETAGKTIGSMHFSPYLQNGVPVQVVSRITMPFKTVRPPGTQTFDSAHNYFERGRMVSFPAAGNGPAYTLHANFKARSEDGTVQDGQYVDIWKSDSEWRREATIGNSRFVRARHGETRYMLSKGPDVGLLRMVLRVMEPIPAIDTFVESDWRIKLDTVDGAKTIRVLAGYEAPDGTLDPKHARGYWFDGNGKLVKTYFAGIETRRLEFQDFNSAQVAHKITVLRNNALGMLILVTDISPPGTLSPGIFDLAGHKWTRAFTDEVR